MGFPFDTPTWDGVSGAIFMGVGGSAPGLFSMIAVIVAVGALAFGQRTEAGKYRSHK